MIPIAFAACISRFDRWRLDLVHAGQAGAHPGSADFCIHRHGLVGRFWQALVSSLHVSSRCEHVEFGGNVLSASTDAGDCQRKNHGLPAGLDISRREGISTQRVEAHYLAGGNVMNVMQAIIAANRAGIDLDFDKAAAIDLAGRDVLDAVRTSVHPKVIDCPDPKRSGKTTLSAIARDGVELRVRTRVTVRTNLEQLIGGATEETIIARVGESIISSIGSSENHLVVLENPDLISRAVLKRGLDAQTAFRSYRSILRTSTSARTSELDFGLIKRRPTRV